MSKAKGKGGTGRGTDSKGWNRWKASANKAKNTPKPYVSKGTKKTDGTNTKAASTNKAGKSEKK